MNKILFSLNLPSTHKIFGAYYGLEKYGKYDVEW
jgi:hypothetical protein